MPKRVKKMLTWKKYYGKNRTGGHWVRWIPDLGKTKHFASAKNENDQEARKLAEKNYHCFMADLEKNTPQDIAINKITVVDAAEKYMEHLMNRYKRGDISASHCDDSNIRISKFVDTFGYKNLNSISEINLTQFRDHFLSCPISQKTKKPLAIETVKDILVANKTFLQWCYDEGLLKVMPRNIRKFSMIPANLQEEPDPKRFSLEEVKTFWDNANSKTRLYIALGLNCGMGFVDIANLKVNEVDLKSGYIKRHRSKTSAHQQKGVYAEHKLFKVTIRLIKKHQHRYSGKTDGNELIFLNQNNAPLLSKGFGKTDGKYKKSNAIRNAFFRVQQKTGINGGRGFYTLRKTGSSEIEKIDKRVTEQFLSHSEQGMKRYYIQPDFKDLTIALTKLEKVFKPFIS